MKGVEYYADWPKEVVDEFRALAMMSICRCGSCRYLRGETS